MGLLLVAAVVLVGVILLYNGIRIVREYQRLVVFRLGRSIGEKGPGVVYLIPLVDRAVLVDLREVFLEIPAQTCITNGLAAGTFAKSDVPIPLDYPQCGLFDYYAGSKFYTDSAQQLQATIEPARQCLLDAAKADGIDPGIYTPEISRPDCFKDVNPYSTATADEAAVSAAFDCAAKPAG